MKIKVCGLREKQNIHVVAGLGADLLGFNFYPMSPRFASDHLEPDDLEGLPATVEKTGIFVNAGIHEVYDLCRKYNLDLAQLHGDESPTVCEELSGMGIPVIKAFRVDKDTDFRRMETYTAVTRYFLFDTPSKIFGGSGAQFDWTLLEAYSLAHPFFLGGGIGPEDAEAILSFRHPSFEGVDVNSKFEVSPGLKDTGLLRTFINKLKCN